MASIKYDQKFKMIEAYCNIMLNNQLNSLIIYGDVGIGKTFTVRKSLKDKAIYYSGGVKGSEELARILYNNREGKTLVLDDFDSCMKTKEMKNILKTALQDDHTRIITYMNYRVNHKLPKKEQIPEQFKFTSSIIFVSNSKRIDPALRSRSMLIEIRLSKNDMLQRIKDCFKTFMPKIPMHFKEEVWKFIWENRAKIKTIDFRQFKFSIATRLKENEHWKDWVLCNLNF